MPEEPTKQQESTSVQKTGQVSSGLIDASFCGFHVQDSLVLQADTCTVVTKGYGFMPLLDYIL